MLENDFKTKLLSTLIILQLISYLVTRGFSDAYGSKGLLIGAVVSAVINFASLCYLKNIKVHNEDGDSKTIKDVINNTVQIVVWVLIMNIAVLVGGYFVAKSTQEKNGKGMILAPVVSSGAFYASLWAITLCE